MATRYYGAAFGAEVSSDVTEAGSTTSLSVELAVVYDATNNSKLATLKALDAIKQAIVEDTWPPA